MQIRTIAAQEFTSPTSNDESFVSAKGVPTLGHTPKTSDHAHIQPMIQIWMTDQAHIQPESLASHSLWKPQDQLDDLVSHSGVASENGI